MTELNELKLCKRPLKQRIRLALNEFFIRKYCKWVTFGRFNRAVSLALDIGVERGQFDCHKALREADPKLYQQLMKVVIKKELARRKKEAKEAQPQVVKPITKKTKKK